MEPSYDRPGPPYKRPRYANNGSDYHEREYTVNNTAAATSGESWVNYPPFPMEQHYSTTGPSYLPPRQTRSSGKRRRQDHVMNGTSIDQTASFGACQQPSSSSQRFSDDIDTKSAPPDDYLSFHSMPVLKQNRTSHSTRVPKRNYNRDEIVAMDCEMVGCLPDKLSTVLGLERKRKKKAPKEISVAGRCTIVGYHGNVLYDKFIRPNRPITSLRTIFSGITKAHMRRAIPIDKARLEVLDILRGKVVIAHHIKNDLDALSITVPPETIRDTSSCHLLKVIGRTSLSLGHHWGRLKCPE